MDKENNQQISLLISWVFVRDHNEPVAWPLK